MNKIQHKTKDLCEAAALWAQTEFPVSFVSLEATDRVGLYRFVFDVSTNPEIFDDFRSRYINEQTTVEPRRYDSRTNSLRDHLKRGLPNGKEQRG